VQYLTWDVVSKVGHRFLLTQAYTYNSGDILLRRHVDNNRRNRGLVGTPSCPKLNPRLRRWRDDRVEIGHHGALGLIRRLPHGKCGDRCDEALKKQNPHGVQLAEDVSNL
jgi:hypothetical protein